MVPAMTASLFSFTAVQPVSAIMRAAERNTRDGDSTQEPNGSSTTTQACEAAWVTARPCAIIIYGVTPTVLAMWWTVIANDSLTWVRSTMGSISRAIGAVYLVNRRSRLTAFAC